MKRTKFFALIVVLALALIGCKSTPKAETAEPTPAPATTNISFGDISWIIEQISPSFWPTPLASQSTMFITFHIAVNTAVPINEVKQIFIASPKDMWLLEGSDIQNVLEMDQEGKKLVLKRLQCAETGVPLGEWSVDITLNDGSKTTKTVTVNGLQTENTAVTEETQPSELSETEQTDEAVSEESTAETKEKQITYLAAKAAGKDQVAALAVPSIASVSRDEDSIEIRFSVKDKRIKNGYFWFDVPGEKYYRDSGSMIDAAGNPVNGCRRFSTDGKECLYILRKDADNSTWFNQITAVYFVVADVNRVQSPWEERIRSVSEKAEVK